jgi:hypothetical protein
LLSAAEGWFELGHLVSANNELDEVSAEESSGLANSLYVSTRAQVIFVVICASSFQPPIRRLIHFAEGRHGASLGTDQEVRRFGQ